MDVSPACSVCVFCENLSPVPAQMVQGVSVGSEPSDVVFLGAH